MTRYILRRKSDGLFRTREPKYWRTDEKMWTSDIHKARLFTGLGHPRTSIDTRYYGNLPRKEASARRREDFDREYEILKVELEWQGVKCS